MQGLREEEEMRICGCKKGEKKIKRDRETPRVQFKCFS